MIKRWTITRSDGLKKEYVKNGETWVSIVYDVDSMGARKDYEASVNGKIIWSIL